MFSSASTSIIRLRSELRVMTVFASLNGFFPRNTSRRVCASSRVMVIGVVGRSLTIAP